MKTTFWIAFSLVLIGALNWGLVGVLGFDAVAYATGGYNIISQTVYALVGFSAVVAGVLSRNILLIRGQQTGSVLDEPRAPRAVRAKRAPRVSRAQRKTARAAA